MWKPIEAKTRDDKLSGHIVRNSINDSALSTKPQNNSDVVLDKEMPSGVFIDGKLTFFQGSISDDDIWNAIIIADAAYEQKIDR